MKKIIDFKDNRGVMSLIVILGIGLFVLAIALTLTGQIVVEMMRGRNTIAGDRSFHAADSAAREGFYRYINDFDYLPQNNGESLNESFQFISIDKENFPNIKIRGAASTFNNSNYREVEYSFNLFDVFEETQALNLAVYAEETMSLTGNATIGSASEPVSYYTGNDPELTGAAATIYGERIYEIDLPTIDDEDFIEHSGNLTINNNNQSQQGNFKISGDLVMTGGTFTGIAIVTGKLDLAGNAQINGLVYASHVEMNGTPIINGTVISSGNIDNYGTPNINLLSEASFLDLFENLTTVTYAISPEIIWQEY